MDHTFHALALTSPTPYGLEVDYAEGIYIYDRQGKKYADLISGIAVSNIGHRHPKVINAIQRQLEKHLHVMVYGEFVQEAPVLLANKLTSLLPPSLNCCYLVNSGTEANEAAMKLAKRFTGRSKMIACKHSYHGSTHGSLSVSGNEIKKSPFRPLLPGVDFIAFNNMADLERITEETACVIVETIQGDAGVRIPTKVYLQRLREKCSETGALLILDEIQCGMGRTGFLFAFEAFDIVPDVLTTAKAFGGGLPLGAFVTNRDVMQCLTHDPPLGHITTFGGNPVCCASALATLDVIVHDGVLEEVEEKGRLFEHLLTHKEILELRRAGLMMAIDFKSPEMVSRIVLAAKSLGVILYWFLSNPHSIRIAPPLTITKDEITASCALINEAIELSIK